MLKETIDYVKIFQFVMLLFVLGIYQYCLLTLNKLYAFAWFILKTLNDMQIIYMTTPLYI